MIFLVSQRLTSTPTVADVRRPVANSMRKKREALAHLNGLFGDVMVGNITPPVVGSRLDGGYV